MMRYVRNWNEGYKLLVGIPGCSERISYRLRAARDFDKEWDINIYHDEMKLLTYHKDGGITFYKQSRASGAQLGRILPPCFYLYSKYDVYYLISSCRDKEGGISLRYKVDRDIYVTPTGVVMAIPVIHEAVREDSPDRSPSGFGALDLWNQSKQYYHRHKIGRVPVDIGKGCPSCGVVLTEREAFLLSMSK
jgi:hypothetical protein